MDSGWKRQAACLGHEPRLFVDNPKSSIPVEAMRICVGCPVRTECLDDALEHNDPSIDLGVWGGTTVRGRQRLRAGMWDRSRAFAHGNQLAQRPTKAEREAARV